MATTAEDVAYELVGLGLNVHETPAVEGRVKWLDSPDEVLDFVEEEDDVTDVVVIVRGGTTTFLTPALTAGICGIVTLQGAPESHLGIVSREYGIPCVMSVAFEKGVRTSRGEVVPADGTRIKLDSTTRPKATVSVEVGAPVSDEPVADAGPGMTPEQLAQIQLLLEKFGGEVPHGAEGDAIMQAQLNTKILDLTDESVGRPLTVTEVNDVLKYLTWNEWDALAARATEGESGLIPRQEYEALGILNAWFRHPGWLAAIEEKVGAQGVVDIGAAAQREIGTKVNLLHAWAVLCAPFFGRGIAIEMGLHDEHRAAAELPASATTARRLYKGIWGEGGMFTSQKNYHAPLLGAQWLDRFAADRIELADADARSAFQKFNASSELLGFLHHFDNRLGLGDSGPYPLPDGGFVVVRDLFVNEPAFEWSELSGDLPYSITMAMAFKPHSGLEVKVTDLSTMFTEPANYLQHLAGVSVYTRQHWDTPADEVQALSVADMAALRQRVETASAALYRHIAGMEHREKVLAGAKVYTAGFILPFARAAGVYDELVAEHGLFEVHPEAAAVYERIVSGVATEMIPRLFLTGSWGVPVPDQG
ncbi:PEP-utilizing enzyme [Pseudonocardia sp. H11422]|uniref:PEP-utilizing enzyme n=1 Tax=Pseudonocardia sp. H11422 TaxID=2835866 RepID=UPI001BDC45E2|nr:PEP-utilizing enzyme [Pseudonocardia sp. H11422]